MAEIIVKYDTEDKTCKITRDGKEMKGMQSASFYESYDGQWSMGLSSRTENEDGTCDYHQVSAAEQVSVSEYLQAFLK